MEKKDCREEALRMERLHDYEWLRSKLLVLQKGIEIHFEVMNGCIMDDTDIKVFNGLGAAINGLQAVSFCLRECQLADELKFDVESEAPADES